MDVHPQQTAVIKGWWYMANGQTTQIFLNGKKFALSDSKQSRGKNFAEHLMALLSLPNRKGMATEAEFKHRVSAAEGKYSEKEKSSTFTNAVQRVNNIIGKSGSGKTFLLPTNTGCKVDEEFIVEFDPSLTKV